MKSELFTGKLEINNKLFSFIFEDEFIVILHAQKCFKELDGVELPNLLYAYLDNEKIALFFPSSPNFKIDTFLRSNIRIHAYGYILTTAENKDQLKNIFSLKIQSPALNNFYFPHKAISNIGDIIDKVHKKDFKNGYAIDIASNTSTEIKQTNNLYTLTLNFQRNIRFKSTKPIDLSPYFQLDFQETAKIETIIEWYRNIRLFFAFLNCRRDINFDNIKLCFSEDKQIRGNCVFFNEYSAISYNSTEHNSITLEDISEDKLLPLFETIIKVNKDKYFNTTYIFPKNDVEDRRIYNEQWAMLSTVFETMYTQKCGDNYKSNSNEQFKEVKDKLLLYIEDCKKDKCFNKKQRGYFDSFAKAISHEGTLEEKFKTFIEEYNDELSDLMVKIKYKYHFEEDFAKVYSAKRNKIMHGTIEVITEQEVGIYILIRVMFYAYILKESNISTENTKNIIDKIFKIY